MTLESVYPHASRQRRFFFGGDGFLPLAASCCLQFGSLEKRLGAPMHTG
ncbi:hypothetical protein [Paenibacillus sp. A3]|nr:hypothetical protein [Paenibacillus sp. A3]